MTDLEVPTTQQARALTDRIRIAVEGTWMLIQEAYTSRAWAALGYDTWDAYCTAEFGHTRLRLPREERQEVVASLRDNGLSLRAIASATGAAYNTVLSDVAQVESPAQITGTDGKTYAPRAAPEPPSDADLMAGDGWAQPEGPGFEDAITPPAGSPSAPAPVAAQPKRRPLPEAFAEAAHDLTRTADKLARLTDDDRFPKNRPQTHHQVPELLGALDQLAHLVTAMRLGEAQASEEARRWWATSLNTISDALTGAAHSINQEHN